MVKRRGVVYECPDCGGRTHDVCLTKLGGRVRPPFKDRDGRGLPAVRIERVLCWWCREFHSPAEVEACMALPRKVANVGSSESSTSKPLDAGLLSQYSELWGFLTASTYPDGAKRKTGRISLSCDVDLLGLSLQCEETGQYAFLQGRDLTSLLEEAELRMSDGSLAWRASKWTRRGK